MTVNTTNITSGPYAGNDVADTFSYTFRVTDKTQLDVYETDDNGAQTLLLVDTDYTVAGIGLDTGGTITRVAGALPTGYIWYIRSDYKETQLTAFASQGGFFPDVHEDAMDKLTFLIQQILDQNTRSFRLSDTIDIDGVFDIALDAAERAGRYLSFNTNGDLQVTTEPQTITADAVFDDVSLMTAATVALGWTVITRGYATAGDGGGATYLIETLGSPDDNSDHAITGGLYQATLQSEPGGNSKDQFGNTTGDESDLYLLEPKNALIINIAPNISFTYNPATLRSSADGGIVIDPTRTIAQQQAEFVYHTDWTTSEAVIEGWIRRVDNGDTFYRLYRAVDSGTTGASVPSHEEATREASDGTVTWRYLYKITKGVVGTGTGCWERNITPIESKREIKWWLNSYAADSTNGNDLPIDAAFWYMHNYETDGWRRVGQLIIPEGTTYVRHGKIAGKGFDLIGGGKDVSTSVLRPTASFIDDWVIDINGASMIGSFAFRQDHKGYTIDQTDFYNAGSMPTWFDPSTMGAVRINQAYNITTDMRIRSGVGSAHYIDSVNDVAIIRPRFFGASSSVSFTLAGIYMPGNLTGSTSNSIRVEHPDIEVFYRGIDTEGTVELDVYSHYLERNNTVMYLNHTTGGYVNIYGGEFREPSSSAIGINIRADNVNIYGGRGQSAPTAGPGNIYIDDIATVPQNVNIIGFVGDKITDTFNYINFMTPGVIDGSFRDTRSKEISRYEAAVADNSATNFFTIKHPNAAGRAGHYVLEIESVDASGYATSRDTYEFTITTAGATANRSSMYSTYSQARSGSGNYSIAISAALTTVDATETTVTIISNQGGALGDTTTAKVRATLRANWNYWNKDTYIQDA